MTARFGSTQGGRKLRVGKRVTGTAAAFAALAALTGSQVTGLGLAPVAVADTGPTNGAATQSAGSPLGSSSPGIPGTFGTGVPADGGGTVQLPQPPGTLPGAPAAGPFAATGPALPTTVFAAYRQAEASLAQRSPGCHLPWQLLAGIGQVESGQANGGQVDASGTLLQPILGPALDGNGFAAIPDTDGGRYDGDARWDRAVGPMQFIPSTWEAWGADANGDGKADPNNVFDAAEAAGRYLCAGGRDLADPAQLDRAVLSYNNSGEYLRTVRNWMAHFGSGTVATVPNRPGSPLPPISLPSPFLPVAGGTTTGTGSTGTTPAPAPTPDPTAPVTPAPAPSPTAQPTTTPSPTTTPTPTGSPSPSATPTGTPTTTPTPTGTPTATPTACPDPSATATPTGTPTGTPTPTGSPSPSATATPTGTPTATPTATPTGIPGCPTPTPTATSTPGAPSAAPSTTPSASFSPAATPKG
ncbi:membrane-bound lytic murein transglycosylase B [Streptomyces sp. 1114.5]|uniref:lytic transglycosylase domain-containing protein n=1 Tax=Streptomyces sp. 1114.5 TaxID=1938830 RepID=UPI000EB053DD|nr:lytic transglycosylase domain-containing protein [Streptomyces sp. 1114.5]RKT08864.1 membrane-bound lytic murein transglycosylase B [Streptomyces sp. 1114.5]